MEKNYALVVSESDMYTDIDKVSPISSVHIGTLEEMREKMDELIENWLFDEGEDRTLEELMEEYNDGFSYIINEEDRVEIYDAEERNSPHKWSWEIKRVG